MDRNTMLRNYAKVLIHIGVNLEKGQGLHITIPAEGVELARAVTEYAYKAGASTVVVRFVDEELDEFHGAYADHETALKHMEAEYAAMTQLSEQEFTFLRLYAPGFLNAVSGKESCHETWNLKTSAFASALRGHTMGHGWLCIGCCPTKRWAQKVFPELPAEEALDKLWEALLHITRSDTEDPIGDWNRHSNSIVEQGIKMTEAGFDALHIVGPGTDLTCGLIPTHVWGGGRFTNAHGYPAVPNIPTEELATTPDRFRVNGTVSSVRPMNFQGEIVDKFWIRFENGKAVEWDAALGKDALTRLITHDEGSCYLGEVAVVPGGGLIGSTNIVYYCTLLDENATCHLALGAGFSMHVQDKTQMDKVNKSAMHSDFMIGNDELCIFGINKDGREVPVFTYGKWVI